MSARITRLPAPAVERAVIYLRQSTYKEESISLEVQEQAARQHAEEQGYTVVGVESDPGITGRSWKRRAGVQRAMNALETGEAEVVIVWRWSRLSRSRRDWAVAADMADVVGGRIESATEPNDRTAAGRFARGVMTELAAFESERIGEQWAEAPAHRIARGLPATGGPRFGYQQVDGAYVVDPVTGPALAELYRLYLGGWGSVQLVRWLHERGIMRGKDNDRPWKYQDVLQTMDAGFGAGLLVRTPPKPKGTNISTPKIAVWLREFRPGAHEPVIDRATWDAYVVARRARSRHSAPMLSGLLRCMDCQGAMSGQSVTGKRGFYRCTLGASTTSVRSVQVYMDVLDAAVEEWVLAFADSISLQREAQEQTTEHGNRVQITARRAQQQLGRIEDRLARLTLKYVDDAIPRDMYERLRAELEAERDDAERRVQDATRNPVRDAAPAAVSPDLRRQWQNMTPSKRNHVLTPLIARVEVFPVRPAGQRHIPRWRIVPAWEDDADTGE
ncbi:recombinase family protein [Microbacterium trichothecenolyticum]|uniref:Site-specific DNA recombinase n=1 Tax=Microbacterium trichothecenolyticum TaxID=69370 RepID=A0ABU0TRF3_MICTR|nr:recombinase family protein [Microbacterium trichothecenolyticum]MDQ1122240.1 site-specific DNA recombinase [Microbacterium trichothecenolyticum]